MGGPISCTDFSPRSRQNFGEDDSRWTSQDPLGFAAGDSNLYRYVNNRPSAYTDPSGELDFSWVESNEPRVIMNVTVAFKWVGAWTPQRKNEFSSEFHTKVEEVWNQGTVVMTSAKDTITRQRFVPNYMSLLPPIQKPFDPGDFVTERIQRQWTPMLNITVVSGKADFLLQVLSNPTKKFIRSSALIGPPPGDGEVVAWLDEADVDWTHGQVPAAHEFGHLLGLKHPGEPGAPDEYTKDASALMGAGNQLRPSYFERWVTSLNTYAPRNAPYAAVYRKRVPHVLLAS